MIKTLSSWVVVVMLGRQLLAVLYSLPALNSLPYQFLISNRLAMAKQLAKNHEKGAFIGPSMCICGVDFKRSNTTFCPGSAEPLLKFVASIFTQHYNQTETPSDRYN